jgi:hypothetical protein
VREGEVRFAERGPATFKGFEQAVDVIEAVAVQCPGFAPFVPVWTPEKCGWASYFKHAVCKHTLSNLANFAWWRVIRWLRTLHRWRWKDARQAFATPKGGGNRSPRTGSNCSTSGTVPVTLYRYRGSTIPSPWPLNRAQADSTTAKIRHLSRGRGRGRGFALTQRGAHVH